MKKRADGRYAVKYDNRFFYGKTAKEAISKRDEYAQQKTMGYNMNRADTAFLDYGLNWVKIYHSECNPNQRRQYETFIY